MIDKYEKEILLKALRMACVVMCNNAELPASVNDETVCEGCPLDVCPRPVDAIDRLVDSFIRQAVEARNDRQ